MAAYYNEIDPFAAAWLRELISAGHIAPGDVDTRSIIDVRPDDLRGYTQCHFFAGIGVWSYALRRAGWPDSRPVWTGSCPCQPFSAAGKGGGFDDERHLWPHWFHLIGERRPAIVFGEQVASKHADAWIDLVQADMEALGYAFGAVPFPSAGVGAPHIRDRTYWLADDAEPRRREQSERNDRADGRPAAELGRLRVAGGMADDAFGGRGEFGSTLGAGQVRHADGRGDASGRLDDDDDARLEGQRGRHHAEIGQRAGPVRPVAAAGELGGLADDSGESGQFERSKQRSDPAQSRQQASRRNDAGRCDGPNELDDAGRPGPANGLWRDADWLFCRDGKWRPVEASPQPLADGVAASLGRVCDARVAQISEEINALAMETKIEPATALRALQAALGAQTQRQWTPGGLPGLHEAPFLLAFLRQLQTQGWSIAEGPALPCSEDAIGRVRVLRHDIEAAGASREQGLDGQLPGERPDALHILSSLLARHAQEAWGEAYDAYAEIGFPLGRNSRNRVMRLRGYGNAINAEAAVAFIEAATAHEIVDIDAERLRLTGAFA